ncbi:hypothetical protein L9F63_021318, partial [Diploptera punctata]
IKIQSVIYFIISIAFDSPRVACKMFSLLLCNILNTYFILHFQYRNLNIEFFPQFCNSI